MNLSIGSAPDWQGYREYWPTLDPIPQEWYGFTFRWPKGLHVPPVFLGQFGIPPSEDRSGPIDVYVFGFRLELAWAEDSGGFPVSDGNFLEYAVVEFPSETTHWLKQRTSNTYSAEYENNDCVAAAEVKRVEKLSLGARPRWKKSEAEWATFQGSPMRFIGQIDIPENNVTQKFMTWDKSVFVFWHSFGGGSVYKITTQSISLQTAEEHYGMEQEEFDKL